ncbi:MAG: Formamidopyrimidine-DNA glycosylase [uncultured Solirubrobacterales bacterium]|uniref:DNA-(apurinic or apyrimidinic site) lyase n=1 Tax=uncultured Solirubrobacterales bacterium TaxID=768556 RepID=A0A6J4T216_9ACTN|nr:MAG: Formamidopyrimidine-DNA glycosylase [uncultured Solirubrobacterales bacterium]
MPEGDTIHSAARRVGAALVGREILAIETPQARHRLDRWPQRLSGRAVRSVDAHGKHLLVRFEGDLTVHSHLRMGGSWRVYRHGERWRRSPRRAWLIIRTPEHEVVQFDGPVLELMTDGRTRFDQRLAALGPDVLAPELDEADFLRRLHEDDSTRAVGDALLDQRNLAGIGNIWKSEGCYLAKLDPWRPLARVSDDEALAVVRGVRPLMRESVDRGGRVETYRPTGPRRSSGGERRTWVYGRGGLPCRACGTEIRARGQGDDNRTTYWCPSCQR